MKVGFVPIIYFSTFALVISYNIIYTEHLTILSYFFVESLYSISFLMHLFIILQKNFSYFFNLFIYQYFFWFIHLVWFLFC